ncbi:cytochrome b [Phenylobacterium sp.]|jgi:cytochrome b561|uniref:cytochrome b n=1 Tax=Phenylobacterium sp. TaxID=1871053 RepID=UPI002F3FAA69
MTAPTTALVVRPAEPLVRSGARFDPISMAFHWATALVVIAMFASAWAIGLAADAAGAQRMLSVHRSLGVTLWVVTLARLAWRLRFATRPPLPADLPRAQRLAAALNEGALYAILLVQPLTGLAQSLARGRPFGLFGLEVPKLMVRDKAAAGLFHAIHALTADLLIGLIVLHVGAALFHGLVRRDGVLASMIPNARG